MEVSGQLHAPAALPPDPIVEEAKWTPESVRTRWWREKITSLYLPGIEPLLSSRSPCNYTQSCSVRDSNLKLASTACFQILAVTAFLVIPTSYSTLYNVWSWKASLSNLTVIQSYQHSRHTGCRVNFQTHLCAVKWNSKWQGYLLLMNEFCKMVPNVRASLCCPRHMTLRRGTSGRRS
jgi:hypothetical protein